MEALALNQGPSPDADGALELSSYVSLNCGALVILPDATLK